jgi:hypothetical protein
MKVVVVGGHTRNIGKTSVVAGLIRGLKSFAWTAVKITHDEQGVWSRDGEPREGAPGEQAFLLSEEKNPPGRGDSCRFLAAGARRALWLRVRDHALGEALPELWKALGGDEHIIIESNSLLEFFRPVLYLQVLDASQSDFKASARRFLGQVDAFVAPGSPLEARVWPRVEARVFGHKPVFPVSPASYSSPELLRFVEERISPAAVNSSIGPLLH